MGYEVRVVVGAAACHGQGTMREEHPMKLTIVAATGGIGRLMLEQAVAAGHDVTAVVRNPAKVTADVRVVKADLSRPDPVALTAAMEGADAVLSGLGGHSRADEDIA